MARTICRAFAKLLSRADQHYRVQVTGRIYIAYFSVIIYIKKKNWGHLMGLERSGAYRVRISACNGTQRVSPTEFPISFLEVWFQEFLL